MKLCEDCKHFWREGMKGSFCLSPHTQVSLFGIVVSDSNKERECEYACGKSARFWEPK